MSGLVTLKGKIYAVGGETEGLHSCKSLECYDPDTDEWTTLAPLIESRFDPCIHWRGNQRVVVLFLI